MLPKHMDHVKQTLAARDPNDLSPRETGLLEELNLLDGHPEIKRVLGSMRRQLPERVGPPPDVCPCCGK